MARPTVEEGFKFWRDEVDSIDRPERVVAYIPILGLVGVYGACNSDPHLLTSYDFRRTVLASQDAMTALRESVPSSCADELEDTFAMPIDREEPAVGTPLQFQQEYASIMDGLPQDATTIAWNEWFIARHLGFARHDQGLSLYPLRLIDQGMQAVKNNYPLTARFIEEST